MEFLKARCPQWLNDEPFFRIAVEYDPSVRNILNQPQFPKSIVIHRNQLAWAAISSGRHMALEPDAFSMRKRQFNQWRVTSALGFLNHDDEGFLVKDEVLDQLEPTEKGQIGFAIGALCATVASFVHFNAIALVHTRTMDRYHPDWIEYDPDQNRRPDYIAVGRDYSCFVVEAKGRTEGASRLLGEFLNKTGSAAGRVAQAAAVQRVTPNPGGNPNPLHITNSTPTALLGVATEYGGSRLLMFAADPPPGITIKVSPAEILEIYYTDLMAAMEDETDDTREPEESSPGEAQLRLPDDLREFWTALADEERIPTPFWRELSPRWREVLPDAPRERLDRYGMLQQFYTESARRAEGDVSAEDGGPIWGIENFRLDIYDWYLDDRTRYAHDTAKSMWAEYAGELLVELVGEEAFARQPDGTILRYSV